MGRLYHISFHGMYTDDYDKKGEWTRIEIQKGKSTSLIYTRDELELDKNFINITTIANKQLTIGTKFIIKIDKTNIQYDEDGEFGSQKWLDRTVKEKW